DTDTHRTQPTQTQTDTEPNRHRHRQNPTVTDGYSATSSTSCTLERRGKASGPCISLRHGRPHRPTPHQSAAPRQRRMGGRWVAARGYPSHRLVAEKET